MVNELILFIISFIFVLIIYEFFIVNKSKRRNSKNRPIEIKYLVSRYKLDLKKIHYRQILQIVSLVSSFDIAFIVSIASIFDSYLIQLLVAVALILPVIFISYHFVGNYYVKKGMIIDK